MHFKNAELVPAVLPVLIGSYVKKGYIYFIDQDDYPVSFYVPKRNSGVFNIGALKEVFLRHGFIGLEVVPLCWLCLITGALELVAKMLNKPANWVIGELLVLGEEMSTGRLAIPKTLAEFGPVGKKLENSMTEKDQICLSYGLASCHDTTLAVIHPDCIEDFYEESVREGIGKTVWVHQGLYKVPKVFLNFDEYFRFVYTAEVVNLALIDKFPQSLASYVKAKLEKLSKADSVF
jgi:hypothetical protein